MEFLLKDGLLLKAEFKSPRYTPITRYLWGKPSRYRQGKICDAVQTL
jgi:hypothetical protein